MTGCPLRRRHTALVASCLSAVGLLTLSLPAVVHAQLVQVGRAQAETFATEIAFDDTHRRAYITNNWTNSVSVIDTDTYQQVARIDVGARPNGIVIDTTRRRAYVANWGSHNISVIDTTTHAVVTHVTVGTGTYPYSAYPTMLALNADGSRLYVTHDVPAGTVSVVDTASYATVAQVITNGGSSVGIAYDDLRQQVYATTYGSQLFAIDATSNTIAWQLTGTGSGHVRMSQATGALYVGSNSFVDSAPGVTKIDADARAIVRRHTVGNVGVFAVGGPFGRVYVPQYWNDRLAVLDAGVSGEIGHFATCCHSTSASIDPNTGHVWFADELGNVLVLRDDIAPPLEAEPQTISTSEDTALGITLGARGGSGAETFTIVSGPVHGQLTGSGAQRTYTPASDYHGPDSFTFRVAEGTATSHATVTIAVTPVNDAPRVTAGGPYTVVLGRSVTLRASGEDVEDGLPRLAWDLDGDGQFETDGTEVPFTPSATGSRQVQVRATDAAGAVATAAAHVSVTYDICLLYRADHAVRSGATVPIRLQLCDASGANVSSPLVAVTAVAVVRTSDTVSAIVEDSGDANPDSNFRYDSSLQGYIFNLKTTGLLTGTWAVQFVTPDATTYSAPFQVK